MVSIVVGLVLCIVAFLSFTVADNSRIEVLNGSDARIEVLLYFLLGCACAGVSGYILLSHLGVL